MVTNEEMLIALARGKKVEILDEKGKWVQAPLNVMTPIKTVIEWKNLYKTRIQGCVSENEQVQTMFQIR